MILFYAPGACSQASLIALIEAQLPHRIVRVDRSKRTSDDRDYLAINPRGQFPALELEDGAVLTESLAILAYVAHRGGVLLPDDGLLQWRALEATSFLTTEVHVSYRPLFRPDATPAEKDAGRRALDKHFASLAGQLGEGPFLLGEQMTIADAYLFVMISWASMFELELPARLGAYHARMKQRPSVAQALREEGLA